MCTALTLQTSYNENFIGRNMDFSHDIKPGIYIMPENYQWYDSYTKKEYFNTYSFIGIGQKTEGILGFFDGVNERGFAAAALYFAGYANYDIDFDTAKKEPISSLDFLHFLLGKCRSVKDIYLLLEDVCIVGSPDPVTKTAAPLHWIATDRTGECVVVEQTKNGLEVFSNPIGVMANSPDFKWHMTNLKNYLEISSTQNEEAFWRNVKLTPFGQGGGTALLPGSFTSPDRFVRTAFLKTHSLIPNNRVEAIMTFFHIIGNVSIPKGTILTSRSTYDYTIYTAFIDTNTCEYFFKTHDNIQIAVAGLRDTYRHNSQPIFLGYLNRPVRFENFNYFKEDIYGK
ncbi:MAG: choloylglycine hydrolase family protein [Firmicutes bacterium]|nr:choloylglycine hydrolase family protein [Bacillota bacterium]